MQRGGKDVRVEARELHQHVVVGIGRRDALLEKPVGLLRLRPEVEAKGELADNVHGETLAAVRRVDDGIRGAAARAEELPQEDVDLAGHGGLELAHGPVCQRGAGHLPPWAVDVLVDGAEDIDGARVAERLEVYRRLDDSVAFVDVCSPC